VHFGSTHKEREVSLLLEQGLQRVFGLFGPVAATTSTSCPLGAPRDIVVAEISPLLIEYAFGRDFLAFIVGVLIVIIALLTAAEISIAMGTGILPAHLPLNSDHIPAKDTIHYPCSSYPNRSNLLITVLLLPHEMAVCDGVHRARNCYASLGHPITWCFGPDYSISIRRCSGWTNQANLKTPEFVLTFHTFRSRIEFEKAAISE
jgi:hypothetical protein